MANTKSEVGHFFKEVGKTVSGEGERETIKENNKHEEKMKIIDTIGILGSKAIDTAGSMVEKDRH